MVKIPGWLRASVYSVLSLSFGVVFGFFSKREWGEIYKSKLLHIINAPVALILLPFFLLLNITLSVIAVIEIINQGITIKNLGALFVELVKTTQTILAILSIAAVISISAIIVPVFLVVAISLELIFNICCFFSHLRDYLSSGSLQEQHENKMLGKKYGVASLASFFLVIGAGVVMLSSVAAPVLLPVAIVTALIASVGGIFTVIYGCYAEKKSQKPVAAGAPIFPLAPAPSIVSPLLDDVDGGLDVSPDGSGMSSELAEDELSLAQNSSIFFKNSHGVNKIDSTELKLNRKSYTI